jgi:hypothetical protein
MSSSSRRLAFLFVLLGSLPALAIQAPVDRAWRSLGMGGAGVAVAEDADAVHLNPAGLTQLSWPGGGFAPLDTLGYKRDKLDGWGLGIGLDPSLNNALDLNNFYNRYKSTIDSGIKDPTVLLKNQKMLDDLYQFDRRRIPIGASVDMGGAIHDLGGALWSRDEAIVQVDHGAVTPKVRIGFRTTTAIEAATARSFLADRLSLGVGYRVVAISIEEKEYDLTQLQDQITKAPSRLLLNSVSDLRRTEDWGHGLDLGFLWFQTPGLRFAGSVRDLGMKLDQKFVTPDLTVGAAWAPKALQRNDRWARKINFGLAYENALYDTLGYKPLSKIDIGAEWMQTIFPHILVGRLSVGIKGGYPTFLASGTLFSVFRGEFLTYGEETGYFTGDREDRVYMVRLGVGI